MYAFNSAAIFSPGHPYIESTTVLSDYAVISDYCKPSQVAYVGSMWVGLRIYSVW